MQKIIILATEKSGKKRSQNPEGCCNIPQIFRPAGPISQALRKAKLYNAYSGFDAVCLRRDLLVRGVK